MDLNGFSDWEALFVSTNSNNNNGLDMKHKEEDDGVHFSKNIDAMKSLTNEIKNIMENE